MHIVVLTYQYFFSLRAHICSEFFYLHTKIKTTSKTIESDKL